MEVAKFRRQKSSYKIGVAKMTKIAKAQVTKMEKENEGKIPVSRFIGWWLDPKNGKVGEEFTKQDGSKGKTTSFHAVTSGFNDAVRNYYDVDPVALLQEAESREICSLRPVGKGKTGKGVPGVRVSAFRIGTDSKGISALSEMGLS